MEREDAYQLFTALANALTDLDARTASTHAERPTPIVKQAVDLLLKEAELARPPEPAPIGEKGGG